MPRPDLLAWLAASRDAHALSPSTLAGRVIANLFFEDSTRTRLSFTVAAMRLGARVIDLLGTGSSLSKGETLIDTARNVEAMGVAALVVRARQAGAASLLAQHVGVSVLNAGDGKHEHPTQGLLDVLTLAKAVGREHDFDLAGLRVAIVGDVQSSRVARSDIAALTALGASVVCVGPPGLAPSGLSGLASNVEVSRDLDAELPSLDAIIMLRIQFERHDSPQAGAPAAPKSSGLLASVREYREGYALTRERASRLPRSCWVMHPGPINRGIELDAEVADGPQSLILRQVAEGVNVRMAALARLLR